MSNKRMNLARSAPRTDRRGPCRLSACWTYVVVAPNGLLVGNLMRPSEPSRPSSREAVS